MLVPLASLPQGARARIVSINAGCGLVQRLMQMGLFPGTIVEVLENSRGPILIQVEGSRIAIGRGMASKILVEPLEEKKGAQS
uniref:Ferrous iron transport protein A n=1 Tax=Fervidicoccus fontis TaxID=683846 RepID=A0A7J3ZKA7_9CREN